MGSFSRSVGKVVMLAVVVVGGWVGLFVYEKNNSRDAKFEQEQQLRREAEAKAELLRGVVDHLQSEERKADVVVTDQSTVGGQMRTTLMFMEYARNGVMLPPKFFTINGNEAHVDAMVVKFQGKFVEGRDPLRGHSIALFTKLFDNTQSPDKGYAIDDPGHVPAVYQGANPQAAEFEQKLWKDFWKLADNRQYREEMGVDVLMGQSVWWRFEPAKKYTITLQPNAGLLMRYEPIPEIYRQMFEQKAKAVQLVAPTPQTQPAS